MSKRSSFRRMKNDAYDTPLEAVSPLLRHLPARFTFDEPCAGAGLLADSLTKAGGQRGLLCDIAPRRRDVMPQDAMSLSQTKAQYIITNPPWTRELLHPLILHLCQLAPTWLLLDAGWAFTKRAGPYMDHCRKVVAVGRLRWIPGSPHTGKDDCAWYLFTHASDEPTLFFHRAEAAE